MVAMAALLFILTLVVVWFFANDVLKNIVDTVNILVAGVVGSCCGALASALDHERLSLRPDANRKSDLIGITYILVRIAIGIWLGVASAYITITYTRDHPDHYLPVATAFIAAYLLKPNFLSK